MTSTAPKIPKNKDEEAALEKALAEYKLARVQAAMDFLKGDQVKDFRDAIDALIEEGLPAGSSALGHLQQIPGFLDRAISGTEADVDLYQKVMNPPQTVTVPPGAPLPGPTPVPPV